MNIINYLCNCLPSHRSFEQLGLSALEGLQILIMLGHRYLETSNGKRTNKYIYIDRGETCMYVRTGTKGPQ